MRKTIAAMLAGILSFCAVNAQVPQGNNEDIILLRRRAAAINNESNQEQLSQLEKISSYDILPIIYAVETNSRKVVGTKKRDLGTEMIQSLTYSSAAGTIKGEISSQQVSENSTKLVGFNLYEKPFLAKISVITNEKTTMLLGAVRGKVIQVVYDLNGLIQGVYGNLPIKGKVVEYDSHKLPKRFFVQVGTNLFEQTTTYDNKIITGHEAKLIEGSSLDKLVENYK